MKLSLNVFMLFASALFILSCDKDDDEAEMTCDDLATVLVGTWSVDGQSGTFEFKEDNTIVDESEVLIEAEVNGIALPNKTWSLDGSELNVRAESDNGFTFVAYPFDLVLVDCNTITIDGFTTKKQ